MNCPKCKKKNLEDSNFCSRCGFDISQFKMKQCSICLEKTKKQVILVCGHSFCPGCIDQQYKFKQECPECRTNIKKCSNCSSFRVIQEEGYEKCLNCLTETHIKSYKRENKILCIDCQSKRVIYNHTCSSYSCLDCFRNFKINGTQVRIESQNNNTTTICIHCFSNKIKMNDDFTYNCQNCNSIDVKTKVVSLVEYSSLKIKSKQEVNPENKKCSICLGSKLFECVKPNGFEKSYYCHTCNKQDVRIIMD